MRTQIAAALGFHGTEQLVGEGTFRDLGLDSLLAVEAKDRLESLVGRPLPASPSLRFVAMQEHGYRVQGTPWLLAVVSATYAPIFFRENWYFTMGDCDFV